jgi:hypothetical protein
MLVDTWRMLLFTRGRMRWSVVPQSLGMGLLGAYSWVRIWRHEESGIAAAYRVGCVFVGLCDLVMLRTQTKHDSYLLTRCRLRGGSGGREEEKGSERDVGHVWTLITLDKGVEPLEAVHVLPQA